jgi:non-ribosomal peptide synthetase component F
MTGTTGTPKGVDVTHRNVTNLVCHNPGGLGIAQGTRVGQVLNISFDMGEWPSYDVHTECMADARIQPRGRFWDVSATEAR